MVYPKHFIHFGLALFLVVALATVMGACSTSPTLSSIAITPESPGNLTVGATQQFAATGTYSDDSTSDITSEVTWNSDNTSVATIDSTGLATGVAAGTADITASMSGLTSPAVILKVS
jgi:hypothetical protein